MAAINTLLSGLNFGGLSNMFAPKKKGFPKTLKLYDFTDTGSIGASATASVAVSNDKFYKLAQYTVPAQQVINIGYGDASQPMNQGYLYIYLKVAAGTECTGTVRVAVSNASETAIDVVMERLEGQLNGDATDKSKQIALPEITSYSVLGRSPREDDKIQIYFKSDTATQTVASTLSTIQLPITVYM